MMMIIVTAFLTGCGLIFIGGIILYMTYTPTLFVHYQCWKDEKTYSYNWSELTCPASIKSGEDIKEIEKFLKEKNGCYQVVLIHWQRFERAAGLI